MNEEKYIKIENRGKIKSNKIKGIENFIKFIYYENNRGEFQSLFPKLFFALKEEELNTNEDVGFQFTLLFDRFKGRVNICKLRNKNFVNIYFFKRNYTKGKSVYNFIKADLDVPFDKIMSSFNFILEQDKKNIKTGGVYLLKNGMICILKKYYSLSKLGVIYDEYSDNIEDYISIDDIEKLIR